jgi:predicted alpha/beta superfamily hydrolase
MRIVVLPHWTHVAFAGVLAVAATCVNASAQSPARPAVTSSPAQPLVIGETFTLQSRVLNEVRRINIYAPPVYADSPSVRLPVLYMPDGGMAEDFLHVAGLVQVSTGNGTMRPFILVGIENTERRRDLTGPTDVASDRKIAPHVGGSAAFRDFIRTELMPEVKRRFRTTGETAIVGESLAGLFIVETALLEPTLFDTYIAIDPSLWWNNGRLVADAPAHVRALGDTKALWYSTSREGSLAIADQLAATLKANAGPTVRWHYEQMPEEAHATIYHPR